MQAMSYRSGHHSTSDDSSRYRTAEEMQEWRARDPVTRFQAFLDEAGWWDPEKEKALRVAVRKEVRATACCCDCCQNFILMDCTAARVYCRAVSAMC